MCVPTLGSEKKKKKQIQQDESGASTSTLDALTPKLDKWWHWFHHTTHEMSIIPAYIHCWMFLGIVNPRQPLNSTRQERQQRLSLLCLCMHRWTEEDWHRFLSSHTHFQGKSTFYIPISQGLWDGKASYCVYPFVDFFAYKNSTGSVAEIKSNDNGVTEAFPNKVSETWRIPGW